MLHSRGQVTTKRLTTLLNDVGLVSAAFVTVDDTDARHGNRNFHTTHIGGEHFTAFRTAPSKSPLNFLALLCGNDQDYVLNDAAFTLLEGRQVDPALLARLKTCEPRRFANHVLFLTYLAENGIDIFGYGACLKRFRPFQSQHRGLKLADFVGTAICSAYPQQGID